MAKDLYWLDNHEEQLIALLAQQHTVTYMGNGTSLLLWHYCLWGSGLLAFLPGG